MERRGDRLLILSRDPQVASYATADDIVKRHCIAVNVCDGRVVDYDEQARQNNRDVACK